MKTYAEKKERVTWKNEKIYYKIQMNKVFILEFPIIKTQERSKINGSVCGQFFLKTWFGVSLLGKEDQVNITERMSKKGNLSVNEREDQR